MSDLQARPLGELIQIRKGKKPASVSPRQQNEAQRPYLLIDSFGGNYKSFTDDTSCPYAKADETLLVWDGERCGLTSTGHEGYIGSTLSAICTTNENLEPNYLFHFLVSKQKEIRNSAEGTGVPHVSRRSLEDLEIVIPPLPEQKKIAEILSGIDRHIAITNSRMICEQHLRAGLLEEMISERRTFLKLDSVTTRVSGHTPSKSNSGYWNGGIPWISLSDTAKLDKRYISDTAKEISEQGIQNSSAVLHPAGLVVLSRDARVGCSAITTKKMAVSQHFIGWICSGQLLNRYLYYVLQKWKHKFEAIAMGSTIPTIGVPFFRDLEIPVPSTSEQQKIADTIESVDCHIEELSQRIYSLQNLKSAISADLLSGRKRVSI